MVGFTGDKGVGITEAVSYLAHQGFDKISLAKPLHHMAIALGMPLVNDTLTDISHVLRPDFGSDTLARGAHRWISRGAGPYVAVYGIRNPSEIEYLRYNLGAKIFGVTMPDEMQYELQREITLNYLSKHLPSSSKRNGKN